MKILLTGADGFTGRHFIKTLETAGHDFHPLNSDLTNKSALIREVSEVNPTHVVHLAAISSVTHKDIEEFYKINLFGTLNLLDGLKELPKKPKRILLASSANIYGNVEASFIDEHICPNPQNHYAMSKLAMEYMSKPYLENLPIFYVRPFNYTGNGQSSEFVVSKIAEHFRRKASSIELGRIDVRREYNDVIKVCEIYLDLLEKAKPGEAYNICSGIAYGLEEIIKVFEDLFGYKINVNQNPNFMRKNEIIMLRGNSKKLEDCIGPIDWPKIEDTLKTLC